jgi:hypothetical protein
MEHITIANSRAGARCLTTMAPGAARERRGVRYADSAGGDGTQIQRICQPPPVG